MNRDNLEFRYFFNAGIDRVTCICDAEGTDVFQDGKYIGSIYWKTPNEIASLDDDELDELFYENDIRVA